MIISIHLLINRQFISIGELINIHKTYGHYGLFETYIVHTNEISSKNNCLMLIFMSIHLLRKHEKYMCTMVRISNINLLYTKKLIDFN